MGIASTFGRLFGRGGPRASYDGAQSRRRLASFQPTSDSVNALLASDGSMLRARARHLVRNNPYAASASESFVANLIGDGIKPSSLVKDAALRAKIQETWLAWTDEADADGLGDFYGLQGLGARGLFEAGEFFIRFRARRLEDGLTVPLQLQLLESEMLPYDRNETLAGGFSIVNGVEFNPIGQRVAYHFYRQHPGDQKIKGLSTTETVRVPASEVLHIFRPLRPGQVRGAPWVAPAVVKLWLLDQYDDAELDRKKIAAMYAGFITSPSPDSVPGTIEDGETAADGMVTLEPGTMQALLPGEEIQFSSPADVGGNYEAFQYRTLLAVFTAMGVPYSLGTGDMKQANYSSLRGALVEYRRRLGAMQHGVIVYQMCRPIWQRWLADAVLSGALTIPGYSRNRAMFAAAKWIPPKFEWVDPYKDRQAELVAVQAGFKSRSDVIEAEGYDPEEVDARIKADKDREESLGLKFSSSAIDPALMNDGAAPNQGQSAA